MSAGDIETFHRDGTWQNRVRGGGEFGPMYPNRDAAIEQGRKLAAERSSSHTVLDPLAAEDEEDFRA